MTSAITKVMIEWAKVNDIPYASMSELRRHYFNRWVEYPRCCVEFRRKGQNEIHRHTFRTTEEAEQFIIDNGMQVLAEKVGDSITPAAYEAAAKRVGVDYFFVQMKEGK